MATVPVGVDTAQNVIVQDNAVTLTQSKFAEFCRDWINPGENGLTSYHLFCKDRYNAVHVVLGDGATFENESCQTACPGNFYAWHNFPHKPKDDYEHFADIDEYEWRVVEAHHRAVYQTAVTDSGGNANGYYVPKLGGTVSSGDTSPIGLYLVTLHVRKRGTSKGFMYQTYMTSYD